MADIKHLINVCYKWVLNHKDLALDIVEQIVTLCLLFKDNKVSTKDKLLILAALIYLISPADLIPDVTISGLADDAAVVLAVIETLKIYITPELKAKAKAKTEELKEGCSRNGIVQKPFARSTQQIKQHTTKRTNP